MAAPTDPFWSKGWPVRFDDYVWRCLYDPDFGFYSSGRGHAGRRDGDFITSPEVGPLFGAVLAKALDHWWRQAGCPEPFVVVDAGAGPGVLTRSLERAEPDCSAVWDLREVDPAPTTERLEASLLRQSSSAAPVGDVVIANELLDNMPPRIVELGLDGNWSEVWVQPPQQHADHAGFQDGEEVLVRIDGPPSPLENILPAAPSPGRWPVYSRARQWIEDCMRGGTGRLLVFDYGDPDTATLAERGGWLRTYRAHQRSSDPYVDPGSQDITVDIGFDQLPRPSALEPQAEFLRSFGIDELTAAGRDYWQANAARPDLRALEMRSRSSEAASLLDPQGLGSWLVAQWEAS